MSVIHDGFIRVSHFEFHNICRWRLDNVHMHAVHWVYAVTKPVVTSPKPLLMVTLSESRISSASVCEVISPQNSLNCGG